MNSGSAVRTMPSGLLVTVSTSPLRNHCFFQSPVPGSEKTSRQFPAAAVSKAARPALFHSLAETGGGSCGAKEHGDQAIGHSTRDRILRWSVHLACTLILLEPAAWKSKTRLMGPTVTVILSLPNLPFKKELS